mgnify:CR=1 FL=1
MHVLRISVLGEGIAELTDSARTPGTTVSTISCSIFNLGTTTGRFDDGMVSFAYALGLSFVAILDSFYVWVLCFCVGSRDFRIHQCFLGFLLGKRLHVWRF